MCRSPDSNALGQLGAAMSLSRAQKAGVVPAAAAQPSTNANRMQYQHSYCKYKHRCCASAHNATWPFISDSLELLLHAHVIRVRNGVLAGHSTTQPVLRARSTPTAAARRAQPEPADAQQGPTLERTINGLISEAESLPGLADVVNEWGGSFSAINSNAAFNRAAKLAARKPAAAAELVGKLASIWLAVLATAEPRQMAGVLWASSKLKYKESVLWSSTLEAFMEQLQQQNAVVCLDLANATYSMGMIASINRRNVPGVSRDDVTAAVVKLCSQLKILTSAPQLNGVQPQHISNKLWACAKLRINPGDALLDSMLQAMGRPLLREQASSQDLANTLWAVSELQRRCKWQPAVREQIWQLLLSEQQLRKIEDKGRPQNMSNTIFALAQLTTAAPPVLSQDLVQQCVQQLLQGKLAAHLADWNSQDVGNVAWACAKLDMPQADFMAAAAANTPRWLPAATVAGIGQVAFASGTLHYKDEQLLAGMLQWCKRQSTQMLVSGTRAEAARMLLATLCWVCWAVAALDLRDLASDVTALVAASWGKAEKFPHCQLRAADAGRL